MGTFQITLTHLNVERAFGLARVFYDAKQNINNAITATTAYRTAIATHTLEHPEVLLFFKKGDHAFKPFKKQKQPILNLPDNKAYLPCK